MMAFTYIMYMLRKNEKQTNENINDLLNSQNNPNNMNQSNEDIKNNHLKLHIDNQNNSKEDFNSNYQQIDDGMDNQMYKDQQLKRNKEWKNRKCLKSTVNNPFMNPHPFSPRNIGPNCSPLEEETKHIINQNFNKHLYKDSSDIFSHKNSDRQFYTVPGNTFPNDRDTFMKWCYSRPKSCKEGNGSQCIANIDPRNYGVHKSVH